MRDLTQQERNVLEDIIDTASIQAVLEALSEICGEKAERLRLAPLDSAAIRRWENACGSIGLFTCDKHIAAVSR